MNNEINFIVENMTEAFAKDICGWKYDGEYSVYNYPSWDVIVQSKWAITIEEKRRKQFKVVVDDNKNLCGYFRILPNEDDVIIGIGLKPSLCGRGLGKKFMDIVKGECNKKYPMMNITLEVRCFNERAIKCYKRAGFKIIHEHIGNTITGKEKFYKMQYEIGR